MGRGNSKRAVKRMKRQGDEHKSVVEQCMFILTNAGYPIQFPWEVPHALTELINGSSGGASTAHSAVPSRQETLGRLAAGQISPAQPQQGSPRQVSRPVQQQPPRAIDPWASESEPVDPFGGSDGDEWGDIDTSSLVDDGEGYYEADYEDDDGGELSPAEMMARYEQGQAGLMQRVAQNGVQYGRGAKGPSAGRRLVPHESVKVPKVQPEVHAAPAQGEYQSPYGAAGDGPRAKNGMTRDQMVNAIERATGRAPGSPKGNPTAKPPGF